MKFIIVSNSYDENSGGVIALHKLCHIINTLGGTAYLYPFITTNECSIIGLFKKSKAKLGVLLKEFKTNSAFNTPILRSINKKMLAECYVLYPETVSGNPLNAVKVIRWFLHHPAFHSRTVNYNSGELYFTYGNFGADFSIYGSELSKKKLQITHFFTEYYNLDNIVPERKGTAYCMRKGRDRTIVHDLSDSILIDGLSHFEISKIFKSTKYFISYDLYTAYYWFAIMCGCIPIVIPDKQLSKEQWQPDAMSRLGVAYGFDDLPNSILELDSARNILAERESLLSAVVNDFMNEVHLFFKK